MATTHHNLTVSETAELLGLGETMVRHLVAIQWLDGIVVGGVLLIDVTLVGCSFVVQPHHHGVEHEPVQSRPFGVPSQRRTMASRLHKHLLE